MSNGNNDKRPALRHMFVSMLFALVTATIAMAIADNVIAVIGDWQLCKQRLPLLTHLFLGLILVATSWVGWSQTAASPRRVALVHIYSVPFIKLLLDVALVLLYFIFAQYVTGGPDQYELYPAMRFQGWILVCVFLLYAVWDVLEDIDWSEPWADIGKQAVVHVSASGACAVIAGGLILAMWRMKASADLFWLSLAADSAMLALVLGFRSLKKIEPYVADDIGGGYDDAKRKQLRKIPVTWASGIPIAFVVLAAVFLVVGLLMHEPEVLEQSNTLQAD